MIKHKSDFFLDDVWLYFCISFMKSNSELAVSTVTMDVHTSTYSDTLSELDDYDTICRDKEHLFISFLSKVLDVYP